MEQTLTAEQKIKHLILIRDAEMRADYDERGPLDAAIEQDGIDAVFEARGEDWELQDASEELRSGDYITGLKCEWSRRYESKAVAAQYIDGSWVGWTYWYGGGKHGEPEGVDWIEYAYDLDCTEEQKVMIVRTFTPTQELP